MAKINVLTNTPISEVPIIDVKGIETMKSILNLIDKTNGFSILKRINQIIYNIETCVRVNYYNDDDPDKTVYTMYHPNILDNFSVEEMEYLDIWVDKFYEIREFLEMLDENKEMFKIFE